jgi:Cu2+-exporting ATPase
MSHRDAGWSVFDRAELRAAIALPVAGGREEVLLGVDGVHCAACVERLRRLLAGRVSRLRVALASRTLEFEHDPVQQPLSGLLETLEQAGFEPQVLAQDADRRDNLRSQRAALTRIGLAVFGAMQVMMLAWPDYVDGGSVDAGIAAVMRWAQLLIATPVVFYAGWPFLKGAWRALQARSVNMDVPVALSILIAWGASALRVLLGSGELYFDTATMFVMLLGIGRYLEGRTRRIAGDRLRLLAGRRTLTATRETATGTETVALGRIEISDVLRVAAGEAAPADGILLDAAALDESLLTGESQAIRRDAGEPVLAGSLNAGSAALRLRITATGATTRLSQITRLLQQAQQQRPRVQLLADRYAGHFVLAVLVLAAASALFWWPTGSDRALGVALSVLVASCPCALSLAVPAVFAAASARLGAEGVLVARPAALAVIGGIDRLLFDKTGTLTRPELQLAGIRPLRALDAASCLDIAAALERDLPHPIARAFAAAVAGPVVASEVRLDPRGGIAGLVQGRRYWLGTPEQAPVQAQAAPDEPGSWMLLTDEAQALALFRLQAPLRPEAAEVVAALRAQGLQPELLTGDGEAPARALAAQVGIADYRARQSPEQKLARLQALRAAGHRVMAVGDGINDAPFLAAADVAVAMPSGAALAQARADVILVGDSLRGLVQLRGIARRATRRLHENLAWALVYNLAVLPLAMGGWLTPWMAALGMSLSSLLVVGNSLRLGGKY